MGLRSILRRRTREFKRGLTIARKDGSVGDPKLAKVAKAARVINLLAINMGGKAQIRQKYIDGIEKEYRGKIEKNPEITTDELIAAALSTPEYMEMLDDMELSADNLRYIADTELKKVAK